MIKMHETISVACQFLHKRKVFTGDNLMPMQHRGNFLVFGNGFAKTLRRDMSSEVKKGFQSAAQAGFRRPDIPAVLQKVCF